MINREGGFSVFRSLSPCHCMVRPCCQRNHRTVLLPGATQQGDSHVCPAPIDAQELPYPPAATPKSHVVSDLVSTRRGDAIHHQGSAFALARNLRAAGDIHGYPASVAPQVSRPDHCRLLPLGPHQSSGLPHPCADSSCAPQKDSIKAITQNVLDTASEALLLRCRRCFSQRKGLLEKVLPPY